MDEENEKNSDGQTTDFWVPLRRKAITPETLRSMEVVLDRIPELPVSVQKIIQMASDPECDSKEIAEVASLDPVLVSHILMMVNSSYYGLSRKIDNLRLAIVLLGFNEVRNIAIRCGLARVTSQFGETTADTKSLWEHSYLVSLCSEMLIGEDDPQRRGVVLTLGMLHDIGKFALYTVGMIMHRNGIRPAQTGEIARDAHILKKEEHLFGINHAIIGGMLTERWNLSERIRIVLECHHFPSFYGVNEIPSEYLEDIATICIADLMVHVSTNPLVKIKAPHPLFFEILGLAPSLEHIPLEIGEKINRARSEINKYK
jgi:HD-like signal output (HDOD) protein